MSDAATKGPITIMTTVTATTVRPTWGNVQLTQKSRKLLNIEHISTSPGPKIRPGVGGQYAAG